jgi:hypothetical protein
VIRRLMAHHSPDESVVGTPAISSLISAIAIAAPPAVAQNQDAVAILDLSYDSGSARLGGERTLAANSKAKAWQQGFVQDGLGALRDRNSALKITLPVARDAAIKA